MLTMFDCNHFFLSLRIILQKSSCSVFHFLSCIHSPSITFLNFCVLFRFFPPPTLILIMSILLCSINLLPTYICPTVVSVEVLPVSFCVAPIPSIYPCAPVPAHYSPSLCNAPNTLAFGNVGTLLPGACPVLVLQTQCPTRALRSKPKHRESSKILVNLEESTMWSCYSSSLMLEWV